MEQEIIVLEEKKKKSNAGRPRFFETPEMLQDKFIEYGADCIEKHKVMTIMGFCLYLGISRECFYRTITEYEDEFADTKKYIEDALEEHTVQGMLSARNPAGFIFYMKNKFGYSDKQEITQTVNNNYSLSLNLPQIEERIQLAKAELARLTGETTPGE
jgi:hypothetical protein